MASVPGAIRFAEVNATPPAPPAGYARLYVKTDNVLYLQDSTGLEVALGSASAITQLTGDVLATGPGVTSSVVAFVGGQSAANVASATLLALAATALNTASAIVRRDASGNFSAGTITANLIGNATTATNATTAVNFTGSLLGDVTGTQGATVVSFVGGSSAANVHLAELLANAATSINTASTIVRRDASGNFSATTITANLIGNASGSAGSFTGSLAGDVTGTQGATVVVSVGGSSAANIHLAELAANAATASNTSSTIVARDASGNFAANIITAATFIGNLTGNVTGNVSGTAGNVTGIVAIVNGGTNSATALNNNRVMVSLAGAIVEAAAITANRALISNGSGLPIASVTTSAELAFVSGVTSSIQTQLNSISGSAVTSLTGDVTGTGPGATATTVVSVGGSSAANIHSAELLANAATALNTASAIVRRDASGDFAAHSITLTGSISASNFSGSSSGTNTGDVTTANTNSINLAFASGQLGLNANLNLSVAVVDAGYIPVVLQIKPDGLQAEVLAGTPVQVGTSNNIGSAPNVSRGDHVHAHGAQTDPTLHALVTSIANGFMSSADKVKLDAATALNTASTLVLRDGSGGFAAGAITAISLALSAASATALTVNTTSFVVDSLNGAVGINTAPAATAVLDIVNSSGSTKAVQTTGYGSNVGFRARRANGTIGSPTQSLTGDTLSFFSARGYGATGFAAASTGVMNIVAAANFTDTSMPTYLSFLTTPTGSVTSAERMRISQTGNLLVGTTTDNNTDMLQLFAGLIATYAKLAGATSGYMQQSVPATTATYGIVWPNAQGAAGTVPTNDGAGNLSWSNPQTNIDGGAPDSVYTASQFINGGTP